MKDRDMDLIEQLDLMILIAVSKHYGQRDKSGQPYILHPIAVMETVDTTEEKIVAVGHDLIEDTDITIDYLKAIGFSENILEALDSITHRNNERYVDYIKRVLKNSIGKVVKRADIYHNLRYDRMINLKQKIVDRLYDKYEKALRMLDE